MANHVFLFSWKWAHVLTGHGALYLNGRFECRSILRGLTGGRRRCGWWKVDTVYRQLLSERAHSFPQPNIRARQKNNNNVSARFTSSCWRARTTTAGFYMWSWRGSGTVFISDYLCTCKTSQTVLFCQSFLLSEEALTAHTKPGIIQKRFAWPLPKDDMQDRKPN